ncbi:sal-like protein 1 [Teleopsis dalmanni]|uniref:sal-like protein 1 n=1 Tax=Teleopsis dalmanni TaxID=139649 RepID=UPI0018CD0E20|nr:sal-like protein 1 [Teleopsis dalmanni]
MLPVLPSANTHHVHLDNNNTSHSAPKRNSSMIFRIEHLLPNTTVPDFNLQTTITTTPSSSSLNVREHQKPLHSTLKRIRLMRSGVYASQFTPKDTFSESITTLALMSCGNTEMEYHQQTNTRIYCTLSENMLCMTPVIMKKIRLSEDIHSYNVLFELQSGKVRIRAVRDIARDEELVAWFGDEVTLFMSLPFLTPLNIQGNNRYTCHICQLTFETPNPLKIHLALGCGRHSLDILWIRLHYAIKATTYNQQHQQQQQQLLTTPTKLSLPAQHSPNHPTSTTSSNSPPTSPLPQRQQRSPIQLPRFSAFKPISAPVVITTLHSSTSQHLPTTLHTTTATSSNALSFLPSLSTTAFSPINLLQPPGPLNAAAQIEAIVSNMGASKQGHLCIYCGKVYSRKYGLKIHIRTHTGFKPLKCKFCLRPFGDPSNLNKHVRLHLQTGGSGTNVEGYKCHLCHKTLARRRDLQRHIESRHSGESVHLKTETTS